MSLPEPYFERDGVTLYHGDCRELLPLLPKVDLVLTDPPYGMNNNSDYGRFTPGPRTHGYGGSKTYPKIHGDDKPFDPQPWLDFDRVIMWGSNHFAQRLPVGTTLVWIKKSDSGFGTFLSDAEIAWMKGGHGVYCRRDTTLLAETRDKVHPNQKPLGLMKWCIGLADDPQTILDPFAGSGTTLRAAMDLGRKAIGIEISEKYCEIAARRLEQRNLQFGETL